MKCISSYSSKSLLEENSAQTTILSSPGNKAKGGTTTKMFDRLLWSVQSLRGCQREEGQDQLDLTYDGYDDDDDLKDSIHLARKRISATLGELVGKDAGDSIHLADETIALHRPGLWPEKNVEVASVLSEGRMEKQTDLWVDLSKQLCRILGLDSLDLQSIEATEDHK